MDLAVAYRVYPGVSKKPILHQDNKLLLAESAFRSFARSLNGVDAWMWVILDGCPPEYKPAFSRWFPGDRIRFIDTDRIGNARTFQLQGEILLRQTSSDAVYFAEDDYAYVPGEFQHLLEFLENGRQVDFVTPYDHPDYYSHPIHQVPMDEQEFAGRRWRAAATTCLTFLTRRSTLGKTWPVLKAYARGASDAAIWLMLTKMGLFSPKRLYRSITKWDAFKAYAGAWRYGGLRNFFSERYRLWTPVPGVATHLESATLAAGHNWRSYLED